MAKVIGIDLGTSNSACAVMEHGRPTLVPSADGMIVGRPCSMTAHAEFDVPRSIPMTLAIEASRSFLIFFCVCLFTGCWLLVACC